MTVKSLKKESFKNFIAQLVKKGYRVVAPTRNDGLVLFDDVQSFEDITLDYIITNQSAKEYFFPRTESLLAFDLEKEGVKIKSPEVEIPKTVIIGTRPCDAVSLPILDKVFNAKFKDDFYHTRREATTLISISCSRYDDACFCTSMGFSPQSKEGSDILLTTDSKGDFIAEVITEKGERLIAEVGNGFVDAKDQKALQENGVKPPIKFDKEKIRPWLDQNFENDFWKKVGLKCLGCKSCASLCPTCHCFDILDEGNCDCGERLRNWDSCSEGLFTLHASGHNPRPNQVSRCRQRVMHKNKYYIENFERGACVGCGRCLRSCPVDLNVIGILSEIAGKEVES